MLFLSRVFKGRFLLTNSGGYGIMGRDVLNCLAVLFDGPRLSWAENKP
jgi:hypothetical protein